MKKVYISFLFLTLACGFFINQASAFPSNRPLVYKGLRIAPSENTKNSLVIKNSQKLGPLRPSRFCRAFCKAVRFVGKKVDHRAALIQKKSEKLLSHKAYGLRLLGKTLGFTSRALKKTAGTETLVNTSVDFGLGAGIGLPFFANAINTGIGAGVWSGSVTHYENGIRDVMFDVSSGINSPNIYLGYSRLGKACGAFSPFPFLTGYKDTRSFGIYLGVAGALEIGLGEVGPGVNQFGENVPARGPFLQLSVGVPIVWLPGFLGVSRMISMLPPKWRAGVYMSFAFTLYSPLLQPITKPLEKKAKWLDEKNRAFIAKAKAVIQRKK